ncbi:MAG: N-acetyl sugar amidotransferase [Thermodesulfovibrionales bacterium]|nr:N-acetyl sugar amidotransferase [Thermodesulfovibrionales bacterium]
MSPEKPATMYGLPAEVKFCRRCVMSNQRPGSVPEHLHTIEQKKPTLAIGEDGVCDACRLAELKEKTDWQAREKELIKLLDRYRRDDGHYDVLVPGSGGKDSAFAAHVLKYKYGMHPLTCTWPPHIYTDIGWKNFQDWIGVGGFDNVSFWPNGRVHRLLTKLATENLLHPFQPFIIGQKNLAPTLALKFGIKLVFYGESEAEYGNPIAEGLVPKRETKYYSLGKNDLQKIYLGGVAAKDLIEKHNLTWNDLEAYFPADPAELLKAEVDIRYLGYYLRWTPQEAYYYAVEHTGFEANPERSEGTYSKYNSIDDRIDGFHYYTTYIKFGLGRATYDASQEIRNKHLTREEGVALVHRFDGEFPKKYFTEILNYVDMTEEHFLELVNSDKFRPPHLWEKVNGQWRLKHRVS